MAGHRKNPAAVALGRLGGKVGGKVRSAAKTRAARRNAKLGGRPRLALPCVHCGSPTLERDSSRRAACGCK
jgi:hypothetical protein